MNTYPLDFPWTSEQLLSLSQHDYHIKTSRDMAFAHKWQNLGRYDGLIWGMIPIKDKPALQTRVCLEPLHFACNCSSYQHPCNHALGLALLYVDKPRVFLNNQIPSWAEDVRSTYSLLTLSESPDNRRWQRIQAGMQDLERWLLDMVGEGLEGLRGKPQTFQQMADRLVDAQLSEVAKDVRQLSSITIKHPTWHQDLLASLGRLYLLVEGFKRLDTLPVEHQSDLALALGWLPPIQEGETLHDRWHILGKRLETEVGRKVQRLWLWGEVSHRPAVVVEILHGKKLPGTHFLVGGILEGTLQFYPGTVSLRAELTELEQIAQPQHPVEAFTSIEAALLHYNKVKSLNPWLKSFPICLQDVVAEKHEGWLLRDRDNHLLPLPTRFAYGWHMQALSADSLWVFGDYDGKTFLPLSVWGHGRIIALHTLRGVT